MSALRDLIDILSIVVPFLLHPLIALEVLLPHSRLALWVTSSKPFVPEQDVPSLESKVILVTGGNGGLGKETIRQLVLHGPSKIYVTARSRAKYEAATQAIEKQVGRCLPELSYLEVDLNDLQSVQTAAEEVLSRETRLDVLVLNAGVMAPPATDLSDEHENHLRTNHIGHFLLTQLLLPLMEQTASRVKDADVRVVTVSSIAYHIAPANFVDMIEDRSELCSVRPYYSYGISKAANILFAAELARRYGSRGIIHTNGSNFFLRCSLPLLAYLFFDDTEHGALNQIWCAAGARRQELVNGAYYTPVGKRRDNVLTRDVTGGEHLWNWTTKQLVLYLK